jgi:hypothetical protein
MSIATLKRKTAAQYNNSSVGFAQFSLNGTHRSQGWVGQDTRGRSLPKTLMKGNVIKGHGGCCGTYPVGHVVQSAVTSLNNPNIVKSSSMNNMGMIHTKYRWIRRPQPFSVVKPDDNLGLNNAQQSYIDNVRKNAISEAANCAHPATGKIKSCSYPKENSQKIHCQFYSDPSKTLYLSQNDYLDQLNNRCTMNDIMTMPKNTCRSSYACGNRNNG